MLATKMAVNPSPASKYFDLIESQIEKANLAELDWALTHMDSSSGPSSKIESSKELVEADSKLGKEDVRSVTLLMIWSGLFKL
jgi:hypothetical protein